MNPESGHTSIAGRLRLAREHAGLSQGQVARLLDLHRPTVSEIEAGRRRVTADELGRFAKIYEVDVDWITSTQGAKPEQDKIELAARELSKLDKKDLDQLMGLLSALRRAKRR